MSIPAVISEVSDPADIPISSHLARNKLLESKTALIASYLSELKNVAAGAHIRWPTGTSHTEDRARQRGNCWVDCSGSEDCLKQLPTSLRQPGLFIVSRTACETETRFHSTLGLLKRQGPTRTNIEVTDGSTVQALRLPETITNITS